MGYMSALGMAEATDLETALGWHASTNHYPPLPSGVVPLMLEVIDAINEQEDDRLIDVSTIGEHHTYGTKVPAWVCAEAWHLEAFLEGEEI